MVILQISSLSKSSKKLNIIAERTKLWGTCYCGLSVQRLYTGVKYHLCWLWWVRDCVFFTPSQGEIDPERLVIGLKLFYLLDCNLITLVRAVLVGSCQWYVSLLIIICVIAYGYLQFSFVLIVIHPIPLTRQNDTLISFVHTLQNFVYFVIFVISEENTSLALFFVSGQSSAYHKFCDIMDKGISLLRRIFSRYSPSGQVSSHSYQMCFSAILTDIIFYKLRKILEGFFFLFLFSK